MNYQWTMHPLDDIENGKVGVNLVGRANGVLVQDLFTRAEARQFANNLLALAGPEPETEEEKTDE